MNYEEREYQETHIDVIIRELSLWRKVCAQLPTGGGKTVEFAKLAYRYNLVTGKSVLILVHREELLQQTRDTILSMYGINAGLIIAGTTSIRHCRIYIGMAESVHRRQDILPDIGLVIIDEAHNAIFNKLHSVFTEEYIIGFTATPKSSSKKQPMKNYYHSIVVGPSIKKLIALGHLAQNVTRCPSGIVDKANLAIASTGDYDIQQMASEYSKTKYVVHTVVNYLKFAKGKKTIVYNVNIEHSKEVTEFFKLSGVNCRHLDGEMKGEERREIIQWFRSTPDAVLCNVGVATMGFDVPDIECIIVNRATTSMPLWLQMCGRGARPFLFVYPDGSIRKKETFTIIDMGGNHVAHGDWSDDRDWTYIFNNPEAYYGGGIAPMKTCPQCEGMVHAATVVCTLTMPSGDKCLWVFDRKKHEEEIALGEMLVVTKNIDIQGLLELNNKRENYFVFFQIGRELIDKLYESKDFSEKTKDLVFEKYIEIAREWYSLTFKVWDGYQYVPKHFDENWHRRLAKEHWEKYIKLRSGQKAEFIHQR